MSTERKGPMYSTRSATPVETLQFDDVETVNIRETTVHATQYVKGLKKSTKGDAKGASKQGSRKGDGRRQRAPGMAELNYDEDIKIDDRKARHKQYAKEVEKEYAGVKNLKLKRKLEETTFHARLAREEAEEAKLLLTEDRGGIEFDDTTGLATTTAITQEKLKSMVSESVQKKMFSLDMQQFGPYSIDYARNGRHVLLGGRRGHIALMDWQKFKLQTEVHVKETIRDVQFLHNETMFAVAQKHGVYIYDENGVELHELLDHSEPTALEFLPYHYLLVTIGKDGVLRYRDTSIGNMVCEHRTRLGETSVLRQNPQNAVIHVGHDNGQVTLWTPNDPEPVVKMLAHRAQVEALAIDPSGRYMATSGADSLVKIWDLRTYKELHNYTTFRPVESMDISQTGMLGLGFGPHVQVWKDAIKTKAHMPYMRELYGGSSVSSLRFCPWEDVMGIGHKKGFNSLVIPGAGEANLDTFEANPFQTTKQRQDTTVRSLLEKLQPEMITLDRNTFGVMSSDNLEEAREERLEAARKSIQNKVDLQRNRMKGRNSTLAKLHRRQLAATGDSQQERNAQILDRNVAEIEARRAEREAIASGQKVRGALDRFKE